MTSFVEDDFHKIRLVSILYYSSSYTSWQVQFILTALVFGIDATKFYVLQCGIKILIQYLLHRMKVTKACDLHECWVLCGCPHCEQLGNTSLYQLNFTIGDVLWRQGVDVSNVTLEQLGNHRSHWWTIKTDCEILASPPHAGHKWIHIFLPLLKNTKITFPLCI